MSDEALKAVLTRALEDHAFQQQLLDDRDATVEGLDLAPHEKALLKSVTRNQLEKMIVDNGPRWRRTVGALGKVALGIGTVGVIAALALPALHGARSDVPDEATVAGDLRGIASAQEMYRQEFGVYGALDNLRDYEETSALVEYLQESHPYEFAVTTDGETFTATARHKTRPDTRKAFVVGPEGEIKELTD